jgi:hypothetical protein
MSNARPEGRALGTDCSELEDRRNTSPAAQPATHPLIEPEGVDFDWVADKSDVVIPEQPATAVYVNLQGEIVIRQQCLDGDDDPIIRLRPENVGALIAALRRHAQ